MRFVINEEKLNQDKDNVLLGFKVWQMWIQDNVFNGAKTKLLLTNDQFKDVQQVSEFTAQEKAEINQQQNEPDLQPSTEIADSTSTQKDSIK